LAQNAAHSGVPFAVSFGVTVPLLFELLQISEQVAFASASVCDASKPTLTCA